MPLAKNLVLCFVQKCYNKAATIEPPKRRDVFEKSDSHKALNFRGEPQELSLYCLSVPRSGALTAEEAIRAYDKLRYAKYTDIRQNTWKPAYEPSYIEIRQNNLEFLNRVKDTEVNHKHCFNGCDAVKFYGVFMKINSILNKNIGFNSLSTFEKAGFTLQTNVDLKQLSKKPQVDEFKGSANRKKFWRMPWVVLPLQELLYLVFICSQKARGWE